MKKSTFLLLLIIVVAFFVGTKVIIPQNDNKSAETVSNEKQNFPYEDVLSKMSEGLSDIGKLIENILDKFNENKTPSAEERKTVSNTNSEKLSANDYTGESYKEINANIPYFTKREIEEAKESYELYGALDDLGRCTVAYACIGQDIMPTEERGSIGHIQPSGWHTVKYPDIIPDKYLYNRCHLIAYCLAGENDNEKNLITGTRYMNVDGMLPFEKKVAKYVEKTNNHVLYRATPIYTGDNLVAEGVLLEAYSVEDAGQGIQFCVFCFNVQPGINIDYRTGNSSIA